MFAKKLIALEYHSPYKFDYQDEKTFRNFISWIENQKIRMYKVEDRTRIDNIEDSNWPDAFSKYLEDLNLNIEPSLVNDREALIEKLLTLAIRYDYSDNLDKFEKKAQECEFIREDLSSYQDPLENIDYSSQDFIDGLHRMQLLLNVPTNQDDKTTILQAISYLIAEKLSTNAIQNSNDRLKNGDKNESNVELSLDSIDSGIKKNDKILNDAAKILRLFHIKELRDLQTKINETIVSVQSITANPKTDSSLGKVGK